LAKRCVVCLDVEGPIINPAFDFAWLTIEHLGNGDRLKILSDRVKVFDEYDDYRWKHERDVEGHSTGTTPVIASLFAIAQGLKNDSLLSLASNYLKFTPGAPQLIKWLIEEKGIEPYFISSAHPAAIIPVAYKLGIPSSHVFCNGYQLTKIMAERYDTERMQKTLSTEGVLKREIHDRFPYEKHSGSKILNEFLDNYLDVCIKMGKLYAAGNASEHAFQTMKSRQQELLALVGSKEELLAEDLWYLLYSEFGVMGAHRKKVSLMSIEKRENVKKDDLVYIGDSIVDADPLTHAGHGISINCTNREALLSSRINTATPSMMSLTHVIEFAISNKPLTNESKETLQKELNKDLPYEEKATPQVRVFTSKEIRENLDLVTRVNRTCKDYVKKL